ncbi:hypothetical protein QCA50_006161 [Cerrena zonata]|uniref:non-specific serine/threonine protein kinase n=1 Tax=Cerrena zonata TaxID=2478898 RepID=A0AAW0GBZ8_9APHY
MRLHIDSIIDRGGFARVYVGQVNASGRLPLKSKVALKKTHVTKHVKNPTLLHEAAALLMLKGHESIPAVFAWGRSQYYEYLALQLLGPTINTFSKEPNPTMRNLIAITCQMFDALEHVHKHHIVHGDVKPGNFLFGTGQDNSQIGRIYLIDFGLAKRYADPLTFEHIPDGKIPALRGTPLYASLNMHYHRMPSRRDDMESLAHSILRLLRGSLPWADVRCDSELPIKAIWSGPALCGDYPSVFGEFLEYTRGMQFEEMPDYKRWRARFRSLVSVEDEPLLYDSSDQNPPLVGTISGSGSPSDLQPDPASDSDHDDSLPSSDDMWFPTSTWAPPERIKEEDLLGNEKELIARELEIFDEPPKMDEPYLRNRRVELMVPLEII